MVAYKNMIQYRWAMTSGNQPYVKLRSKRSGLMASIMFFPKLDRYVVRHFHTENPRDFQLQQRNEFPDLKDAWKFARRMIA